MIGKWLDFGLKILPAVWEAITLVEKWVSGRYKGQENQALAVFFLGRLLAISEDAAGDLLDDEATEEAVRSLIDSAVKVMNVVSLAKANKDA